MPIGASSFADGVRIGSEVFHTLKKALKDAGHNTNVGDEGGFAPNLKNPDEALSYISKAVEKAGYKLGEEIFFALDQASTEFFKNGKYELEGEGKSLTPDEMVKVYADLCKRYPIFSIELTMNFSASSAEARPGAKPPSSPTLVLWPASFSAFFSV